VFVLLCYKRLFVQIPIWNGLATKSTTQKCCGAQAGFFPLAR